MVIKLFSRKNSCVVFPLLAGQGLIGVFLRFHQRNTHIIRNCFEISTTMDDSKKEVYVMIKTMLVGTSFANKKKTPEHSPNSVQAFL